MVGREAEVADLQDLLDTARAGRTAVRVLTGEPGIGKSTLLERAATEAEGFTVLWTRGVESDAALGHAGLLSLLAPLRGRLSELPDAQATALGSALGWEESTGAPAPLQVAGATLALISAEAAQGPVLVVVDDAHWLDQESATALLFAVRRMREDPVAFLFAARSDAPVGPDLSDLPATALAGLTADEVGDHWPELVPAVAEALADETRGNPLVLGELVPLLTGPQLAGAAPLPSPLPMGARPLGSLVRRLAGLSPEAVRLVLLHACAGSGEDVLVAAAAAQHGLLPHALDEAVATRALVEDAGVTRLAHPLLRSAALAHATPAERRTAHVTLATTAADLGHRAPAAWHRAAAAVGHDDALAHALAGLADDGSLGSRALASQTLERAASLTPDEGARLTWLARAAGEAFLAGDLPRTRSIADRVLAANPDPATRAEVLYVLGVVEEYAGSVVRAEVLLAEAAELATGVRAVQVLAELGQARFRLGDLGGYVDSATRVAAIADDEDPYQRMLSRFATGWAASLTGDQRVAGPALAEALDLAIGLPITDPQTLTVWQAIVFSPDLPAAMEHAAHRLDQLRREGLAGLLVSALTMYTFMRLALGDHAGAFADAGEAAELADHLGQVADAATSHEALAWQCAARGLHDAAAESLARSAQLLEQAGLSSAAAHHALSAAFCALSRDDHAEVVAVLEPRLAVDGGMGLMGEPLGVAPLLVESLVALGRRDEAAALARQLDEVTPADAPPVLDAPRHRCLALVADDADAARAGFGAALTAYAAAPDVFEVARTRLLLGSWLRRRGDRVAAREQLDLAAEAFGRMELTAWVAKAHSERAATGERARPRGDQPVDEPLTSQETRVALLVAQGMSNKEVAAQLFLSPRTVETHLAAVFRKRGFRNRTDLAVRGLGS